MRVTQAAKEVGIINKVAVDWYNFCRDIYSKHFLANSAVIGGPGTVVEIDESKFGKWSYSTIID